MSQHNLNMENEIEESYTFNNQFYRALDHHMSHDDASFRLQFALQMTHIMLDKLHRVLTSCEREALVQNKQGHASIESPHELRVLINVSPYEQFRIDWEIFYSNLDVISNITHDFTTNTVTGFVKSHKITNYDRIGMAETMIVQLIQAIDDLKESEYKPEFKLWLQHLLICWKCVQ